MQKWAFLIVLLVFTAVSPALAQTETPAPTATPLPVTLRLFVERDWLVFYVVAPEPLWLRGLQLRTEARTAQVDDDFDALTLTEGFAPPGACFVYRLAGSTLPLPSMCSQPNRVFQREVPRTDVFWYDFVSLRPRAIAVRGGGVNTLTGEICPANLPDCPVSWLITPTPTPTPTETTTPGPTFTPTPTPPPGSAPTATTAPVVKGYPCDATIIYNRTGLLNIVRGGPSSHSSYRPPIQQGAAIRILSKDQETRDVFWYHIADANGNELGWIPVEYAVLSANCPG